MLDFETFTSVAKITHKIKFVCQQFSYEVPCHNIAEFEFRVFVPSIFEHPSDSLNS